MRRALLTVAAILLVGLPSSAEARGWMRPVDGPLLRAFSVGVDRFAAGQHRGVDLGAPPGERVLAACGGRVSFAGRVPRGGRTVSVRCGPLIATYQHLSDVAVTRGQAVVAGARIGSVGQARPRPHVHLGARVAATRDYIDPLTLLSAAPRTAPPLATPVRRPPRLDPAPAPIRPPVLGPAPAALPLDTREPQRTPARRFDTPVAPTVDSSPPAADRTLPWPVWLGLALFGLGLPLGGGILTAGRRRRVAGAVARTA
jgi:hypothetical protein